MRILLIIVFLFICSCTTEKTKPAQNQKDCWAPVGLAMKFRASGEYQKSIDALQQFNECDLKPNEEPGMVYYYHLGWTYYEMGDFKRSIETYTKGIPQQPDYYFVYWRRGLSYEKIGAMEEAEADYKMAYELLVKKYPTDFMDILNKNPNVKEKLLKN